MSNKYKNILIFLFFLFSSVLYAQINKEEKPLSEILTLLQQKYPYQFTYADDVIKDIFISPPLTSLTFKEAIDYLKKETGLVFQFLENNFVAINSKNSSLFICGYVFDKETGNPIEEVTIVGKNSHTITDTFGYFKLTISQENESIIIRHLGFQPISRPESAFEQNFCSNIFLTPQIETISEIILTNLITRGINKAADGTYNINFSNFGILPGLVETDVLQTVQALPGIQSINETVSDINIRGGTNDQNLILWDGVKMYQTGHFFGLISIFNPLITTDMSLIKNGTGVDFTDGVSGTIEMKTNTHVNNTLTGSIGANFINVDGFVDAPLGKKSSLQVSARKAVRDVIETPTYDRYFDRILQDTEVENNINSDIKFDFYDTSLRWLYDITDKDKIRLNFLYVNTLFDAIEESKVNSLKQESVGGGIFYKRNWNDRFTTTLQIYESDYILEAQNDDILQQQRLEQENKVSETSIKLNSWFKYNTQLSFLNGYQITETGVTNSTKVDNPVFQSLTTEVIREHALYSQINFTSNSKNTHVRAGLRYSYIEKFNKHIVEPRLSLNHKIFDQFTLEVLGEFKHQNTSQIVNIDVETDEFFGIEKRRWRLANNKDFPVTTSKQASLGFNYSNKGWLLSAEGYYKEVKGITSLSQGFLNQYNSQKAIGDYNVKGVDFLINKRFNKISTWLSYSFGDNTYTFKELQEIDFPNNIDITHTITFGSSFSITNFKISAGFNYHTGKPTTRPVARNEIVNNVINYENSNSSNLEEYIRVDASATYGFNLTHKIKAQAGISIWNAFNHDNIINNYYKISDFQTEEVKNKALSFTPNMTFRVQF